MILESLNINLNRYGEAKGTHTGRITFTGSTGDVSIELTPKHCQKIFEICGDALVDQAQKAAEIMTVSIIDMQLKQLEGGENDQ